MNAIRNKNVHFEEPFPGCLRRMDDLFDASTGVTGNRQLTDRSHGDGSGSSLSRSRSDVARMLKLPFVDQIEEKQIVSELSRSAYAKTTAMPMKMLIAQELSKEGDAKHNQPNVVAKLMGLDTLPRQRSDSAAVRSHSKGYSRRSLSHSSIPLECWQQDDVFSDKGMQSGYIGRNECRDVDEIWQQSHKSNYVKDKSPEKKYCVNINEKKMALVREKFIEAKRLATDEKLRQSKEFQEALEFLSSNEDLFLKFLQKPNSLFSQHFSDMQSIPPPLETKRITVLRPSRMVDRENLPGSGKKSDKQFSKPAHAGRAAGWEKKDMDYSSTFSNQNYKEHPTQPTRIVVLKPTPGKTLDIKAAVSPPSLPPRVLQGEELSEEFEDEEAQESREVAKEITRLMRENLMRHRRDEKLMSSVLSNGYIGDESSFDKSENEYAVGNISDSEVMSPTSKHSWDYLNRFGSPYSFSSFSRASCSPESSVCREAKKQLSERWATIASNGSSQEHKHVRRSSCTLGEMLALSDSKKLGKAEEDGNSKRQEPRGSTSVLSTNVNKEDVDDSPINLPRSNSLPVSYTIYGDKLNPDAGKSSVRKELSEAKSMTSVLKVKVSNLFFSRSKRLNKERFSVSQSKDESQSSVTEVARSPAHPHVNSSSQLNNDGDLEECISAGPCSKPSPNVIDTGQKQSFVSREAEISASKHVVSRSVNKNRDQPSPVSVLELPTEDDDNTAMASSGFNKPYERVVTETHQHIQSNIIDKSPLIGSIARTLSWADSCSENANPYFHGPSLVTAGTMEEEQEWLASIQTLLSTAGIDSEVQLDSFFARWHSADSPLDSSLRDKYTNMIEEPMHVGKQRQRRSNRKLVFDCVNGALVEITGHGRDNSLLERPCSVSHRRILDGSASVTLSDCVWARIKEWFYREDERGSSEDGDMNSLVVDRAVRKELAGNWRAEHMRLQVDVGKEIEGKLLDELVEEAVVDLIQ